MWINLPRPSCLLVHCKRMRNVKIKWKRKKKSMEKTSDCMMHECEHWRLNSIWNGNNDSTYKINIHLAVSHIYYICKICIAAFSILLTCSLQKGKFFVYCFSKKLFRNKMYLKCECECECEYIYFAIQFI